MIEIKILYEDADFVAVNKPPGLVVHADGKTSEQTLVDWILARYPDIKEVGEPLKISTGETIFRPGIVHRIDRETSGVLLIAKNQEAYLHAKKQFQEHQIKKIYNAFVYGSVKANQGRIEREIGRSKNDFRKWTSQRGSRGELRPAITEYTVLKRGNSEGQDFSFVEARPLTGRTHQIRVHFKALNHPVMCDKLYAPNKKCLLGFNRLALHAASLEFTDMKGKKVKVTAPLPHEFENALKILPK